MVDGNLSVWSVTICPLTFQKGNKRKAMPITVDKVISSSLLWTQGQPGRLIAQAKKDVHKILVI
jgi:hypothetical protein